MTRYLLIALAALLLGPEHRAPAAAEPGDPPERPAPGRAGRSTPGGQEAAPGPVPLEFTPSLPAPLVRVKLDDGSSRLFMLALESPYSLLDTGVARELRAVLPAGAVERERVRVKLRFRGPDDPGVEEWLHVLDLRKGGAPGEASGALGADVLGTLGLDLDFERSRVTFFPGGVPPETLGQPKGMCRLPLHRLADGWLVSARIDGIEARWLLASTYDQSLVAPELLERLKPLASVEQRWTDEPPLKYVRLRELAAGSVVWKSPVLACRTEGESPSGTLLGLDFLKRNRVILDLPARTLYLLPLSRRLEEARDWVLLGLRAVPDEAGILRIRSVVTPSPAADAGLKPGDELVEVAGKPAVELSPDELDARLSPRPGEAVSLRVRRGPEEEPREVRLKRRRLL